MYIAITRSDGGVSIMGLRDGADIDANVAKWEAGNAYRGWSVVSHRVVDRADIPLNSLADRAYRNALIDTGAAVQHDMPKARDIHMGRIRSVRDAELKRLDVEYMRADERGDNAAKQALAARKQALRDIPQTFDLTVAATIEELASLWPADLVRDS